MEIRETQNNWSIFGQRMDFFTGRTEFYLARNFFWESIKREAKRKKEDRIRKFKVSQMNSRLRFTSCVDKWHGLTDEERDRWFKKAKGSGISGCSLFISKCVKGDV